jgi:5-methyltetrahydropteroyltriglutamate--homocysteine methyltransferase
MAKTTLPVKVTLPGPLSVADSTFDAYYNDERKFAMAFADAVNEEARALDALGPAVIQFDEPAFSRYPEKVVEWGIEALERCMQGLRAAAAVHICYSYPIPGVPRPIVDSYPVILKALEGSNIDQISLEFEASGLSPELLALCPSKTVLFGCISNGPGELETPERVASRLLEAARYLPPEQIQAAPDCGLLPVGPDVARKKLAVMVEGARLARDRIGAE